MDPLEEVNSNDDEMPNDARAEFLNSDDRAEFLNDNRAEFLNDNHAEFLNSERTEFLNSERTEFLNDNRAEFLNSESDDDERAFLNPVAQVVIEIDNLLPTDYESEHGIAAGQESNASDSYMDFMLGRDRDYRELYEDINSTNRIFFGIFLGLQVAFLMGLYLKSDPGCNLQLEVMTFWDTVMVGANLMALMVLQRYAIFQDPNGVRVWLLLCRLGTWAFVGIVIYQMVLLYDPDIDPACYRMTLYPCLIGLYVSTIIFAGFLALSYLISFAIGINQYVDRARVIPAPSLEPYTTLYTLATLPEQFKQDFCSICLDDFINSSLPSPPPTSSSSHSTFSTPTFRQIDICKHIYHRKCIDEWLIQNNRHCPLCRSSLREQMELQETVDITPNSDPI